MLVTICADRNSYSLLVEMQHGAGNSGQSLTQLSMLLQTPQSVLFAIYPNEGKMYID